MCKVYGTSIFVPGLDLGTSVLDPTLLMTQNESWKICNFLGPRLLHKTFTFRRNNADGKNLKSLVSIMVPVTLP